MYYNVLLVDDEKRIRVGLSNYIDWNGLGYAPPFLAANIEEARSILNTHKIDLLITDIRLPDGTGLELSESIRPQHPDLPIFLLSAYGDFEYAREAINLGIKQYFTKPTDLQALSSALANMHRTLEQRCRSLEQQQSIKKQHARTQQFLLSRLWRDLANGTVQEDAALHTFFQDCGIRFPHPQFALAHISDTGSVEADIAVLLEVMKAAGHTVFPFSDREKQYIFVNTPDALALNTVLSGFLSEHPNIQISSSDTVSSLSMISKCMIQLRHLSNTSANPDSSHQNDTHTGQRKILSQLMNDLLDAVKANKRIDSMLLLDKLYQAYSDLPPARRCDIFNQIVLLIQQYTRRFGITLASLYGDDFSVSHTAQQLSTPIQMDQWLREHISTVFKVIQNNKRDYSQQIINSIHAYISSHYADEITLSSVAQVVHLSPYYISKLFKKTTGENFIDYLTSVRIEKAMELLASPDVRVYDVAERVGYKSTKHFSQVFRTHTGKTPSEYRQIYYRDSEAEQ